MRHVFVVHPDKLWTTGGMIARVSLIDLLAWLGLLLAGQVLGRLISNAISFLIVLLSASIVAPSVLIVGFAAQVATVGRAALLGAVGHVLTVSLGLLLAANEMGRADARFWSFLLTTVLLLILSNTVVSVAIFSLVRAWRPILIQDGHTCPQCGYCLRGLTSMTCPECGTVHTPDQFEIAVGSLSDVDKAADRPRRSTGR